MSQKEYSVVEDPKIHYIDLTGDMIEQCNARMAEEIVLGLLAERARVKDGGIILSWSEFNENPDPLVNRLLARILISQIDSQPLSNITAEEIAVLSIENSAGYLASEITHELESQLGLRKPPRIIRARKTVNGERPSPAMGGYIAQVDVHPITSGGKPRMLIASMAEKKDLEKIKVLVPVDDFRATGSSLNGGIDLGLQLLQQADLDLSTVLVLPMAGLGKPEQEQGRASHSGNAVIMDALTAVDVHFWADREHNRALIQVNGFPPYVMHNATVSDFSL